MALSFTQRKRLRPVLGLHRDVPTPGLIHMQLESFEKFLQRSCSPDKRKNEGLQKALKSAFPIESSDGSFVLEFLSYNLEKPRDDENECIEKGLTYSSPLKMSFRLTISESDTAQAPLKLEQELYACDIPIMSQRGIFIINGVKRVIVSQLHRSAGVFFDWDKSKSSVIGRHLASCRLIPQKGSWLDFEIDSRNVSHVKIDRKKKLPATTLLYAMGMTYEEIVSAFHHVLVYKRNEKNGLQELLVSPEVLNGMKLQSDLLDTSGKVLLEEGTRVSQEHLEKLSSVKKIMVGDSFIKGQFCIQDIVGDKGLVLCEAGDQIDAKVLDQLSANGISSIRTVHIGVKGSYILNTLNADKASNREEALTDVYRILRPGEVVVISAAEKLFQNTFFDPEFYDLSPVACSKLSSRFGIKFSDGKRVLSKELIVCLLKYMFQLQDGIGEIDDIDHLSNRRVRSVGELLENQVVKGLSALRKATFEQINNIGEDRKDLKLQTLVITRHIMTPIRDFFNSSELSQFIDQTNPLSELAHKRRISALGQGGLNRERAGFEVRDVHTSHYGRICPIETPEGANIGLINSFALYTTVDGDGFLQSSYFPVRKGVVQRGTVRRLTALEEASHSIASGSARQDESGKLLDSLIHCRKDGEFVLVPPDLVDYIDVSPRQIISISASLIPYLENDDANRALMGSNMQRQAVPIIKPRAPFVGTGMEEVIARDSGVNVRAKRSGVVKNVDSRRIVVESRRDDFSQIGVDVYRLEKFKRSNSSTCINQKPLVKAGDQVEEGDIISDSSSMDMGELALGSNVLVSFASHKGYNFEDAIVISRRLVRDDVFTSVHIQDFTCTARDTKLGPEEVTRHIPNIGEEALSHLDESGIAYVGTKVKEGDILVGKVIPKGETIITPEEKLLRTIFGQRVAEVKDISMRVPPGVSGTVVGVSVLNRQGVEKDDRTRSLEAAYENELRQDMKDIKKIYEEDVYERLYKLLRDSGIAKSDLSKRKAEWWNTKLKDKAAAAHLKSLREQFDKAVKDLEANLRLKLDKVQRGYSLIPGVLKMVHVYLATRRNLQPGDKMAGRHGNKGVVSVVLPEEDMPYLKDGTSVDMILNPLGVPSRMNVGQILETHLGWAAKGLGKKIGQIISKVNSRKELLKFLGDIYSPEEHKEISKMSDEELGELARNLSDGLPIAAPVFESVKEKEIVKYLEKAGLDTSGQVELYDGCTGELMLRKATVGYMYMMKLHHLVDDKMHARSTGPYSLVTQQPLGGKSQFGGQRLGEMEVWALQGHGAAYNVMEMLTVKSDDVQGRNHMFSSIVRGYPELANTVPESFNVLTKEMRSLALDMSLTNKEEDQTLDKKES